MENPKIRFKGFTKAWEQRKLSDVVNIGSGMDYKHLGEGNIPVYGTGGYMCSVDKALSNDKDAIGIGRKGTIDKPYILRAPFWTVDTLFYCIPKEGYDLDFTSCLFQNVDWKKKDESTGVPSLSKLIISNVETYTPTYDEQKKIGEYFQSLDHLITLHQRKCEQTKNLKKYMLQKMFPQNGAKVPEIRFDGFTYDWEQRKFGELYSKVSEKNDLSFGADKIISVANMYFKEEVKDSSDEYMRTYNVMRLGDIAFEGNKSKNYSHGRFVENTIGDGIVSHVFDVFRPTTSYDLLFWKYLINNEGIMGRIMARCTNASTMMTNLVASDFLKEKILAPSLKEQKKIGAYFDNLDHLITLHQRKCDELKKMKKYMLQNMFI